MISEFKNDIVRNLSNVIGWRTPRKIVVIESDDWGSIRMPSLAVLNRLIQKGLPLEYGDAMRYNQNDTLATEQDLIQNKDCNGHPAVFTAISLVANPDFEKIRRHNFEEYFYEPFTETLLRYYGNTNAFFLWKQGIADGIFIPQFHGREHLNVAVWMNALQANDEATHLAFNEGCWGFSNKHSYGVKYQAAFDLSDSSELFQHQQIIKEGLSLFEKLFQYRASFFVPPNGPFNNCLTKVASENGIRFMSGAKLQNEPLGFGKTRKCIHYLGQQNKFGQQYLTRNCFFEPSQTGINWIKNCLSEIETAFRWRKPAIISSHRVNYIGTLNEQNRKNGLTQLNRLLKEITARWPDVEFMSSNKLGELL
jgi:hypothetical protein